MRNYYRTISGFCSFCQQNATVEVTYTEIPILNADNGYKKTGFQCSQADACTNDDDYRCPLFLHAPDRPF